MNKPARCVLRELFPKKMVLPSWLASYQVQQIITNMIIYSGQHEVCWGNYLPRSWYSHPGLHYFTSYRCCSLQNYGGADLVSWLLDASVVGGWCFVYGCCFGWGSGQTWLYTKFPINPTLELPNTPFRPLLLSNSVLMATSQIKRKPKV